MKSLLFTFLTISVFSLSAYSSQIGSHQVKDCALVVPTTTTEDVLQALMSKGYHPMNTLNLKSHHTDLKFSGSYQTVASDELHQDKDLAGIPYLEIKEEIMPGASFSELSLGVVANKGLSLYKSEKTTFFPLRKGAKHFSVTDIPDCVN